MCSNIEIGSYAYRYLCNTSSRTDLNYLQGVDGPIGRCFTLIGESGERTFAISPGHMNQLRAESIPEDVIAGASALVLTSYLVRCKPGEPMPEATMKAIEYAKKYNVPVVLTLGTKFVIAENPQWWQQFLKDHVSILAMNEDEAEALTGESDPLLASDKALDWVDLVLCTAGPIGLYMAGFTEDEAKRKTQHPLLPGAIAEFNQYEFSRAMRHKDCQNPLRVYSHIAPYMGGPEKIMNTNGAGDGALAALLHDITANSYHRSNVPNSSKHKFTWLTYSSLAQVCKYANRVSYQVLNQHSPRLTRGLPEREDSPGRVLLGSLSYRRFVGQIRRSRRIWHLASRCLMRRWRVLSCLHIFHILHPATTVYPVTTSPAGGVSSSSSIVRAISRSPITT